MFGSYEEWEGQVPSVIKEDTLWRMSVYRLALFLADLVWHDTSKVARKPHCDPLLTSSFAPGVV